MLVTFDLFSALTDSRRGGSTAFAQVATGHGWDVTGEELYDRWDAHNKREQRDCVDWVSFHELSARALEAAYGDLGLPGDVSADLARVEDSVADWPLWPDVPAGLSLLAGSHRLGVLSNVDDALFATTRAAALFDPDQVLTSERLQAYKPAAAIYQRAAAQAGSLVHVASSARDVRGALEAGITTIRLARPGHVVDPDGPAPAVEVTSVGEIAGLGRLV